MLIAINVKAIITIVDNTLYIISYICSGRKIITTRDNMIKYVAGISIKRRMTAFRYKKRHLGIFDKKLLSLSL